MAGKPSRPKKRGGAKKAPPKPSIAAPKTEPAAEVEKLRVQTEANISALGSEFAIAQEWGLFPAGDAATAPRSIILASLEEAQKATTAGDFGKANTSLLEGRAALNQAQLSRPVWYFANNRFGLLPLFFTAVSASLAYWLVFVWFLDMKASDTIHHAAFLGLAGAVLKALYWLQYQINKGLLRPRWFTYFIVAPFVGVLLGGVACLIVKVGFKLAAGKSEAMPDWRTVGLVAAFAGFNWEWALEKFKAGADAVASRFAEKGQSGGKPQNK